MVYIDYPVFAEEKGLSCHMVADTEEELHAIATSRYISKDQFYEATAGSPAHYKLTKTQRVSLHALGAILSAQDVRKISERHRAKYEDSKTVRL